MPNPLIDQAVERLIEENGSAIDLIPDKFCSMCEKHGDWIVPNDEEESKEKYPWFCTNCEDASEIINLREQFVGSIRTELQALEKAVREEHQLALAEAQLLGFSHARFNRDDLIGLVESMGLSKNEWESLQKQYSMGYLTDGDRKEISDYLTPTTEQEGK